MSSNTIEAWCSFDRMWGRAPVVQWLLTLAAFCFTLVAAQRVNLAQAFDRPVVDEAGVLSPEVVAALETGMRAHHAAHGHQVGVLVVQSTSGEPIEDYAHRKATEWGLGRETADDGVLLVLATGDRRSRLEVGYGLEERLTDATARAILDSAPTALRRGDYDAAVTIMVNGVVHRLGGSAIHVPGGLVLPHGQSPSWLPGEERVGPSVWESGAGLLIVLVVFSLIVAVIFVVFSVPSPTTTFSRGGVLVRKGDAFELVSSPASTDEHAAQPSKSRATSEPAARELAAWPPPMGAPSTSENSASGSLLDAWPETKLISSHSAAAWSKQVEDAKSSSRARSSSSESSSFDWGSSSSRTSSSRTSSSSYGGGGGSFGGGGASSSW